MDIFLTDPSEVPLPPDEVRIRKASVEPFSEGKRVRVQLELDPSQRKPSVDLAITDPLEREVASVSIIESITRNIELVMHIPSGHPSGTYQLQATLYYFREQQETEKQELPLERQVVDSLHTEFSLEMMSQ